MHDTSRTEHEDFGPLRLALVKSIQNREISLGTAMRIMQIMDECDSDGECVADQAVVLRQGIPPASRKGLSQE